MARARGLAFLVLAMGGTAGAETTSFTIRTSAIFQRLGDWRIDRAPTLQGAVDALGEPSRCRTIGHAGHGRAVWVSLGVSVDLVTLGVPPPGRNACTWPAGIYVNWVRVTARRWVTARGLRVGDPVAKLHARYPQARARRAWPRPHAYWLVTRRGACIGICDGPLVITVPPLVAEERRGRVLAFFFPVGAQGE